MASRAKTERIYARRLASGALRYDVTVDYLDPASGKRVQRRKTFASERDAKQYLAQRRVDEAKGRNALPSDETLGGLAADWLRYQAMRVKPTTMVGYSNQVKYHVLPYLGDIKLGQLTGRRIEQHYGDLHARGVGEPTIRLAHRRIVQLLGYAMRLGILETNVARDLPLPGYSKGRSEVKAEQCWNDEEVTRFLDAVRESYQGPLWHVALATGMRKGELLGLRWRDVDEEAGKLHVCQNRANVRARYVTQSTKSGYTRDIAVDASVFASLRKQKARQAQWRLALGGWPDHDLVFTTCTGETPQPHNIYQNLRIWQKRAGVPRIRMHDLRHTHATMLLRHGRHVKEVAERLGHSSAYMTLRVYAHALPEDHRETAALVGKLLGQ